MRAIGIVPALHGAPVADRDGRPLGTVEDLLVDVTTNRPAWLVILVDGRQRTVVPTQGSRPSSGGQRVAWAGNDVRSCPVALNEASLDDEDVVRVCRHYGVRPPEGSRSGALRPVRAPVAVGASPVAVAA